MYRAPIKDQFLRECYQTEESRVDARYTLERVAPYEKRLETDISAIGGDALQDIVSRISSARGVNFAMDLCVLQSYVRWCLVKRFPGTCDDILDIQFSGAEKYKRKAVANPVQLQAYLDQVFSPESDETIDVIYRSYFWLAFSGIDEEDAVKIRADQLNLDRMQIMLDNGRVFPIYVEALSAFHKAISLNDFAYRNPNYKNGKVVRKDRVDSNLLLRGIKKKDNKEIPNVKSYRSVIIKKTKLAEDAGKTTQCLSYSRVYLCGSFFRAYCDEVNGLKVRFYRQAAIDCRSTNEESALRLARRYDEEYRLWKLAFRV